MITVRSSRADEERQIAAFFFKTVVLFLFYVIIIFMRIDRLLCELNIGTRSEVKQLLKKGLIFVNGTKVQKPETQVEEQKDVISYKGVEYTYRPFVYFMMNKPAGVVSATKDSCERTVLDVLTEALKENLDSSLSGIPVKDIFPVGRLDKDTVGLLLLTNDGELSHNLLSPKKHVEKCYYVETDLTITEEDTDCLKKGVDIGNGQRTKEAKVEILDKNKCRITITEGKFHQIKRMFHAAGLKVMYLKRISMGSLTLDEGLPEGGVRELTQEEVMKLCYKI